MAAGGWNQLELSKTNFRGYDEDERDLSVSQEDTETTKRVLYNFIFTRAETDNTLTTEQRASFNEAQLSSDDIGSDDRADAATNAQIVGRRLADLGDEIDAMYTDQFEDIVELYDNPQEAFRSFSMVLHNVFNWQEGELPTLGHIAAVLGYCYHLCKHHIQKYLGSYQLLSLLGMLAGFLVKFFIKAKVYDWIASRGGWGQLLSITTSSWFERFGWNNYYFLAISAVSLTAFFYFKFKGL